jgi:Surface-adhesin protein E
MGEPLKRSVRCFEMSLSRAILWIVIVANTCFCLQAQTKDKWQRVYTGEESVIDMNVSSSTLEAGHVLRVDFRTTLAKPENIASNQSAKYKSRIETISFKLDQNRYRLTETALFDARGAKLDSYTSTTEDWRVLKQGGVMDRLFNAARTLSPFGSWKVVGYKFADGSSNPEPAITKLVGTRVRLQSDTAQVGAKVCSALAYEDKRASKEELNGQLGVRLESLWYCR